MASVNQIDSNFQRARRQALSFYQSLRMSRIAYRLNNLNNLNNFKVQLRWLPLTESTQICLCDSVCVSSNRKSKIENRKKKKSKIENRKKKKIEKNLNNLNNFKVQLRWLLLTESTQIFLCDSVCVSSNRKSKIENRKKKSKIKNQKS